MTPFLIRRGCRGAILTGLLSLSLLTACSTARRGEPVAGPLVIDSEQVARGRKAFMTFCDKCHPGGESGLGLTINNKPLPGALIKTQVRAGMGAMPAFSKELLSDQQLDDLVAYIKALRKK